MLWFSRSTRRPAAAPAPSDREPADIDPADIALELREPEGTAVEQADATSAVEVEIVRRDLTDEQASTLNVLYWESGVALDSLPYTDEYEQLHGHFALKTGVRASKRSLYRVLVSMRKAGKLKRPGGEAAGGE